MKIRNLIFATCLSLLSTSLGFSSASHAQTADKLNDAQIASVVLIADDIDISYAKIALAKSKNPEVRTFAETMVRDHTAVQEQAAALAKKLGLVPVANDVGATLTKNAEKITADLNGLDGKAFDKYYADNEFAYHKFVNGAVETVFIPNAKNAEFKALLTTGLGIFKTHQGHAEMMVKSLQ